MHVPGNRLEQGAAACQVPSGLYFTENPFNVKTGEAREGFPVSQSIQSDDQSIMLLIAPQLVSSVPICSGHRNEVRPMTSKNS